MQKACQHEFQLEVFNFLIQKTSTLDGLSMYSNWEIIQANLEKPWDWHYVSRNPNITWDIIQAHPEIQWNWCGVSQNPNITWDIIQANPEKPWNWYCVSRNPNITWDMIQAHPEKPWNWHCVSWNPNITWEIIQANPEKPWDWYVVSMRNNIYKPSSEYKSNVIKRWHAANVIKRAWFRCNTDPEYAVCRSRLLAEYKQL